MKWLVFAVLIGCAAKPQRPPRPLSVGAFGKYKIEPCASGGHVVKLTYVVDERGEAANKHLVEAYRDRYLLPKLADGISVKGWTFDSTCGASGLTLAVPEAVRGEALHRVGETLARNPTDIEVTVIGK